ncbi:unnamed protein product [Effrenium voratum]|uniref:C3H1-type domain-containing protein n=1 Tax=Effrenium voratum TaxID=2562239 RepID=A0AA36NA74_9DINO|nr:unnamed protein product [Effrenium voratum]
MSAVKELGKRLEAHKKTRLCKFFALGACTRGLACSFAHGTDQLRSQPDFSKTRLCADFTELGSCADGRDCKFAHGRHELRPGSAAKLGRKGERKAELEVSAAKPSPLKLQRLLEVKAAADDFDVSFWSRQTTLEDGRPIAEAEHSDEDAASVASDAASLGDPEVRLWEVEVPRLFDAEIQVKNTFVEMKGEQRSLRRILSEPSFMSSIS